MKAHSLPGPFLTAPHIQRLLAFGEEVLNACDRAGITPILDGSLAVQAHTHDPSVDVRDMDFNCAESEFIALKTEIETAGIFCEIQPWRVLQARREGLKVEFGAIEEWMQGLAEPLESLRLPSGRTVPLVARNDLVVLYQRGLDATAGNVDEREKNLRIESRLNALMSEA